MTPTSGKPLNKVLFGGIAAFLATALIALIRNYVWPDLPADLEEPINTLILGVLVGGASLITGYLTKLKPGEVKLIDAAVVAGEAGRHGTRV